MRPNSRIGYLLQHVAAILNRQVDQMLQERLNIGFSQLKILMVLQRSPSVQQSGVANALGQTEASVSRQIKLLIEQGLLTSHVNEENRRVHLTTLTKRGLDCTEKALDILDEYHAPIFGRLGEEQKTQLTAILEIIHGEACKKNPAITGHILEK